MNSRKPRPAPFMETIAFAALLAGALSTAGCGQSKHGPQEPPTLLTSDGVQYLSHEVVIQLRDGASAQALRDALSAVGGHIIDDKGPLAARGFRRVQLPDSTIADLAISQLTASGTIAKAERNYLVHASVIPNDTQMSQLWGMTKINAPQAWDTTTGSSSVLVAISDTGIDYTHPELAANVWTNPGEIPGNGIDDDHNGYIDDVHGWDFANNDSDPMDDHGHGTHVSGTIGAVGNNANGVAGVNWKVKLVGTKFLGSNGSGTLFNGAQTILYAATVNARVVNASWGCSGSSCFASYMLDALNTLASKGGLFVAAAGNNGTNNDTTPDYPANYAVPNLLSVAAMDSNDALASFSDWGPTLVHLGAPGVGILSTLPGNSYASWSGTSMAAPHVTGAAALYLSIQPNATYAEVRQKILDTVDPVPSLAGKTTTGGRLNVGRLIATAGHAPASPSGFDATAGDHGNALLSWAPNTETDLGGYRLRWGNASGQYTQSLDIAKTATSVEVPNLLVGTPYYFALYALSATGLISPPSPEKHLTIADRLAPPQVVDLSASIVPGADATAEVITDSGEFSSYWAAANAMDGNPDTAWISPGRPTADEESLTAALFTPYLIDSVTLIPNASYPAFFPIDFDIEVSADGSTWTSVGGLRNATANPGDHVPITFPATLAAQVRLHVLRSFQHQSGLFYASIAEMAIHEASTSPDTLVLTFTAPGDDPGAGRATSYDIRRALSAQTDATFSAGAAVPSGAPLASGLRESLTVTGLAGETTYFFAMKATDDGGNVSPLSNVAQATTLLIPPSTITDLRTVDVAGHAPGTVLLAWTAPGADGHVGQAARYDLRWSLAPMTPGDFAGATPVLGLPSPAPAGSAEQFAASGLTPGHNYYFALRAIDGSGAVGGVSNVVWAMPSSGADGMPPATVTDLSARLSNATVKITAQIDSVSDELSPARAATNLLDGDVSTAWMTGGATVTTPAWVILDYGSVQPLAHFRTNPSSADLIGSYPQDFEIQTSSDKVNWTPMVHASGVVGTFAQWNDWSGPVTYARYARLYVTKRGPAAGSAAYVAMGELETYALTPALDADLTWVAPGDDGYDGTAVRYDLRQSTAPITDGNFVAATVVPTLQPLPGGQIEVLHIPSVPVESTLYFAIKAVDADGNCGALSNIAALATPGVPPAPVGDLAFVGATSSAITLSFTATGDDGMVGNATAYELRYARTPISPLTWDAATPAPTSPPQAPGTRETFTVSGLLPTTLYYFAVKVVDDVGTHSPLSNVVSASTLDGTPPAAISDLQATQVDPTQRPALAMTVTGSSGSYSPETGAGNLLDAVDSTVWISPGNAQVTPMFVTFDLGGARRLGRLRMRPGVGYADLFPVDFKLEVQATANGPWQTVVSDSGLGNISGWQEWALGAVPAVTARLTATRTSLWNGKYYTALGDVELYEDPADYGTLRLSWTAPGDDGQSGTATSYDLRRAATAISAGSFGAATPVTGVPAPHPAGYLERFDASGLTAETTYCFAVKASDEAANVSAVSNSACATTPGMPPATITDLGVGGVTAQTATLTFTAPGADGTVGTAARYDVRQSTARINGTNWDSATAVSGVPAPHAAGAAESITVSGLAGATKYYFAVRAIDGGGNSAAVSNNASGTTADNIPPGRVTDLSATTYPSGSGSLQLTWTAPGDNGMGGQADHYDLRVSPQPIDDSTFTAAASVPAPAPQTGGAAEHAVITGLPTEQMLYVALKTVDRNGNTSALSNVASARTRDEAPGAISDLTVIGGSGRVAGGATLIVQWTAQGDDGSVGTATSYEIRYSTTAISAGTFASATLLQPAVTPAPARTVQQATLTSLPIGVKVYVAMKATDDRGNVSALSNVASSTTPDELPPAATVDLTATAGTSPGQLIVSLTAPGDDGTQGTAKTYDLRWSLVALDANSFASAAALTAPAPATAGTHQQFTVSGLPNESTIHLMIRASDDVGNLSPLSNDASAATMDVAPSAITNLRQIGRGSGSLTLAWTATGDDGTSGTAVEYDLRYSQTAITDGTFTSATRFSIVAPQGAGSAETATVTGLPPNKTYFFAIKARDDRGNWSPLSNIVSSATDDTLAPSTITDLVATTGTQSGSIVLRWTATGDDGSSGTATRYELRRALTALNAGNFSAGTLITVGAPRVAGSAETFTVTGLQGETTHHFMIRAIDDAGNAGGLSGDAAANTAPVAPSAISDLTAQVALTGSTSTVMALLRWTAPGDDGTQGTATAYDIRYATTPISDTTFSAATPMTGPPSPRVAGTFEGANIDGLAQNKTFYFAVKTVDDTGTWSALSNVATLQTPDMIKPGAPASLSVTVPDNQGKRLAPTATSASSTLGPSWEAANVADQDPTSSWSSAGSDTETAESLTLDLGAAIAIDQVRLTPDAHYLSLFPRDFTIAVSTDNNTFTTVASEQAFTAATGDALTWGLPKTSARYVRLAIAHTAVSFGRHYAIVADFDAWSASATDGQAQLTWVAPGDDGFTGTAARYQVYRHTQPFTDAQLGAVTNVSNPPAPLTAGMLQTMTVTGLHGETTYYWAIRAIDAAGNIGPLSTVVSGRTNNVAPSPVRDLAGSATGLTSIALTWTATGDDAATGAAASQELRMLTTAINSQNFASATLVTGVPAPASAGAHQSVTVSGLLPSTSYRFALVAKDAAGNASMLSNVAVVSTQQTPDTTPPAKIADFTVALPPAGGQLVSATLAGQSSEQAPSFKAAAVVDGNHATFWASAARAASQEEYVRVEVPANTSTDEVRVWPADGFTDLFPPDFQVRVSPDGLAWTTVATKTGYVATQGQPALMDFAAASVRFVEVRATRLAHPASGLYYAAVAEVEIVTATDATRTIAASWTSPSDDGPSGHAASYDLRVALCPMSNPTAAPAVTVSAPREAGMPERTRVTNLGSGRYCLTIRSTDAAGNTSDFSDMAALTLN
ncbi:MAG TPA: discoidin domain-containing protein [Polyangia bacterium]